MAASLGNATVNVLARTVLFEQSLKRSLKRMSLLTAGIFAAVGTANFLGGAIKNSLTLEKQLASIQTLLYDQSDAVKQAFDAKAVRGLSDEIGVSAKEIADALYYILSSGTDAADAFDVLRAAQNAAIPTGAKLAQTADFLTSALNAYGDTGLTASKASDILVAALNEGKGTMNDFAKYISTAIPIADSLGVSLEEVASFAANNTLTGSSARKVFTQLQYALLGLNDTTSGLGKAFQAVSGKSFAEFVKGGGSVYDAVKLLGTEVGKQQLVTIKGAKTGLVGLQQSLNLWDKYADVQKAVANSDGVAAKSAETVNQTVARQIEMVKNRLVNFRGSVGDWLLPVLSSAITTIQNVGPKIRDGITNAFAPLKPIWDALVQTINDFDWAAWGGYVSAIFTGIGIVAVPVIGVILGLLTALIYDANLVYKVLDRFRYIVIALAAAWAANIVITKLAILWNTLVAKSVVFMSRVTNAHTLIMARARVATLGFALANGVAVTQVGGLRRAMILLKVAFMTNPIGITITALALLAAGFIYAWKNSEKFRDVMKAVFRQVIQVVYLAVKTIMNIWLKQIDFIISSAAKAFGWVPGIGKKLKQANKMFDQFAKDANSSLDNIRDKVIGITFDVSTQDEGFGTQGLDQVYAQIKKDYPALGGGGVKKPKKDKADDDSSGGGYDENAEKNAKAAAAAAAKALKAAMSKVAADLKRISKNIGKQSVDQIKENFKTLYTDMKTAKASKSALAYAHKQEKALIKEAKLRDKVILKLDKAKDKLKELTDANTSFFNSVRDSFLDLANVTTSGYSSFEGLQWRMEQVLIVSREFQKRIAELQKTNLDKDILKDIIEAGPTGGLNAANAILQQGQVGIDILNGQQKEIEKIAKDTAKATSDGFFKAGISAAEGLVSGLEKNRDKLIKAMEGIADALTETVKKKLKIHSPSQVFETEIGAQITAGMMKGVTADFGGLGNAVGDAALAGLPGTNARNDAGASTVEIYATGPTLNDIIKVEIRKANRDRKNSFKAGSTTGINR